MEKIVSAEHYPPNAGIRFLKGNQFQVKDLNLKIFFFIYTV